MSDFLVNLGANRAARGVLSNLGIPVPQRLRRATGPYPARPLDGRTAWVGGDGLGLDLQELVAGLGAADGADPLDVLLFDASGLQGPPGLRTLYDAMHPRIRSVARCGRVVIIGRPEAATGSVAGAVTQAALEGFVRSVAKEVGRKGATANLLRVAPGAESHVEGALRFLLSDASVYVSGQPLDLDVQSAAPAWTERALAGQVALVTGAARGIGAATTRRLAAEGATVVLVDRPDAAAELEELAQCVGGRELACDITDPDAPARIATVLAELGGAHVVVHNAGVTRDRTLGRMPEADWDLVVAVNLAAILRINDALLAGPLQDGARIVLLSSTVGIAGNVGQTNYAATKAAVAGLARRLGADLAVRRIAVSAIAPGFIETRMTAAIPFTTREGARRLSNLSQGGLPEDVAQAITFLASPLASGVTGRVLRVCGGSLVGA